MADKPTRKVDIYGVYDEDGNRIGELRYPQGPDGKSYLNREQGNEGTVYKPNNSDKELWESTTDATVTTDIDPIANTITVTGPKWLTSQVVNSDSFKKNISENGALASAISLYQQDPNASMSMTDGTTQKVSDVLNEFKNSADLYGNSFAKIKNYKDTQKEKYGVEFDDTQVAVATNFVDKKDYKGNEAIYIPKWAADNYDWSKLESFDPEHSTISAKDFFENVLKEGFFNKTTSEAREEALEELKKYLNNNAYDRNDEKTVKEKEEQFANEDYKNDLARTMQFYGLLNENDPEVSAAYNVAELVVSGVNEFLAGAAKFGYNSAETVLQIDSSVAKAFSFGNEDIENTLGAYFNTLGPGSVFAGAAFFFGEMMLTIEGANVAIKTDDYGAANILDGFIEDLGVYVTQNANTEAMRSRQDFYVKTKAEYDELKSSITGWWSAGKVVGNIAWKIVENLTILNKLGAGAGNAVKSIFTSASTAGALGKIASSEAAASLLNAVGKTAGLAANVGAQSFFETLLDNKELVNKAIESGKLTPEVKQAFYGNFIGNLIGESMGPMFKGTLKGIESAAEVSDIAKFAYLGINKIVSATSGVTRSGLARFFALLNGVKPTAEGVADAFLKAAEGSSRKLALYNVSLMFAKAQASLNVARVPIFREVDSALADTTHANYLWVFGGKKFVAANSPSEAKEAITDTFEKMGLPKNATEGTTELGSETVADTAKGTQDQEKIAEAMEKVKEIGRSGRNIDKNYQLMRENILLRANLQNNIDAITKGKTLKWEEMKQYSGKTYDDMVDSSAKVRELEVRAGKKLSYWDGGGTALSRESSEYLSAKTIHGRYAWKIAQAEAAGGWDKALSSEGNRLFATKGEYDKTVEYAKMLEGQMNAASDKIGPELKEALDDLHTKAGKFHMKIVEYMGRNGYISEDEYNLIKRLANNQGWGENGELYLPTSRLQTEEDMRVGFLVGNAWMESQNTVARKMLADAPKKLQLDAAGEFGDPISNLLAWTVQQAGVAQAQEFGRAIHAVSAPVRAIKGFDLDGVTRAEVSVVEKTTKDMQKEFSKLLDTTANNSVYSKALAEVAQRTWAVTTGAREAAAKEAIGRAERSANAVRKRIEKTLFQASGYKTVQRSIINQADDASLTELIAKYAGDDVPNFNVDTIKAADFKEWFASLPETSQKQITEQLSGQKLNITNVKKLASQNPNFVTNLKRNYVSNIRKGDKFLDSEEYKNFIIEQYNDSVLIRRNTVLSDDVKEYYRLMGEKEAAENLLKESQDADNFVKSVDGLQEDLMNELVERTRDNDVIKGVLDEMKKAGASEEVLDAARKHLIMAQVLEGAGKDGSNLVTAIVSKKTAKSTISEAISSEAAEGVKGATKVGKGDKVAKLIGKTLKDNLESAYAQSTKFLQDSGFGEYLDTTKYFENIQKEMDSITEAYGFRQGQSIGNSLLPEQRRKVVQMVGPDGQLRYYETSPLYAELVNFPTGTFKAKGGAAADVLRTVNSLFRFFTTGIDSKSYITQWFRDPINAIIVGGYKPFIDLSTGGLKSKIFSFLGDSGLPLTKKAFNKYATQSLTEEFVESTFEASKRGLIEAYGQEWFDNFTKEAVGDLTGAEAETALKRATAQFATGEIGYNQLPGLGGATTSEFFAGTGRSGSDGVTAMGISKERAKIVFGEETSQTAYRRFADSASEKFNEFLSDHSRGNFREQFLRKGVYSSQYRAGLEAGMTHAEAKVWATRYALDATTNFSRTFMWGNSFVYSVPYLGAAINGTKSFWRLVEMDPIGITKRLFGGLILPYARMLTAGLSDPQNREVYKNLKEYEKADSLIFVADGTVFAIPCPQELSGFLTPFRHVIEKSADVQDNTWTDLIVSDMLGILPLDMSGFVNLDANRITGESTFSIQRGLEKFASTLMSPTVKTAYMLLTGRDPYTGQEIDKSYYTLDENGEMQLMDSTKSNIAKLISEKLGHDKNGEPMLSASAALTLLQTLFGRSSATVLDGAYDILNGTVDPTKWINDTSSSVLSAFEVGEYNKARSQWQSFYNQAIEKRTELVNNEKFQKAFQGSTDENYSEEKRAENKRIYNEMLDDYTKFVFSGASNMKALYPEQYTNVRMASVMSLLVLPQGLTLGGDTAYDAELRDNAYYQAKNAAVNTFLRMGFPDDTPQNNTLGTGYYDKYGQFQFKVSTPYQIEQLQSTVYGTGDRIQAEVRAIMDAHDIKNKYSGKGYQDARDGSKADYKAYKNEWNAQMVNLLYPLVQKYGIETIIRTEDDRELLNDYIFVDNPYKAKEYLRDVFQGAN